MKQDYEKFKATVAAEEPVKLKVPMVALFEVFAFTGSSIKTPDATVLGHSQDQGNGYPEANCK